MYGELVVVLHVAMVRVSHRETDSAGQNKEEYLCSG